MSVAELEQHIDESLRGGIRGTVDLGGYVYQYRQWTGQVLASRLVAIDTETALIDGPTVPELALVQVYDGEVCYLVHPGDLARFLKRHRDTNWITHNASFDFWVTHQHLTRTGRRRTAKKWIDVVDQGRLVCTMLLDQLFRNSYGAFPRARDLSVLAEKYCGLELNKSDPWRLKYGEIIGVDWSTVDRAAWNYAVKDPIATRLVFIELRNRARLACNRFDVLKTTRKRFGLLTLKQQVKAAIVLDGIYHRGVAVDTEKREGLEASLHTELGRATEVLDGHAPAVFKRYKKTGQLMVTPTGKPRMSRKLLEQHLSRIADEHLLVPPRTEKTKTMSLARDWWTEYRNLDPLIAVWLDLEETAKLIGFFGKLQTDRVHARYQTMVRTLRTSAYGPNIQQIPRRSDFRELFVADPGHVFLIIDYSALELRTLAAVLEQRYGGSELGDVIRSGRDVHEHTAAMLLSLSPEQFEDLPDKERKLRRQQAKAVNFGVPGGLGALSLAAYAKTSYGVDLSIEDAEEFREKLLYEVYPELGEYMESDIARVLAENLAARARDVRNRFGQDSYVQGAKAVVQGRRKKRDGTRYRRSFVNRVWESLQELNRNPRLEETIRARTTGERSEQNLFFGAAVVPHIGMVRGRCTFTARHNTPFQGLAAIGAKVAMWELFRGGYDIAIFCHDEFVIQLPETDDYRVPAEDINRICCEAMESVCPGIPITCEYGVCRTWSKDAKAVEKDGRLVVWSKSDGED